VCLRLMWLSHKVFMTSPTSAWMLRFQKALPIVSCGIFEKVVVKMILSWDWESCLER
jgi:hypothetical protein